MSAVSGCEQPAQRRTKSIAGRIGVLLHIVSAPIQRPASATAASTRLPNLRGSAWRLLAECGWFGILVISIGWVHLLQQETVDGFPESSGSVIARSQPVQESCQHAPDGTAHPPSISFEIDRVNGLQKDHDEV